jgi:hypothetical protein
VRHRVSRVNCVSIGKSMRRFVPALVAALVVASSVSFAWLVSSQFAGQRNIYTVSDLQLAFAQDPHALIGHTVAVHGTLIFAPRPCPTTRTPVPCSAKPRLFLVTRGPWPVAYWGGPQPVAHWGGPQALLVVTGSVQRTWSLQGVRKDQTRAGTNYQVRILAPSACPIVPCGVIVR